VDAPAFRARLIRFMRQAASPIFRKTDSTSRAARSASQLITRYFEKFHASTGTFFIAASRHETDSFRRLFLAPQQKAMGRF
jgi:hypothetical protein